MNKGNVFVIKVTAFVNKVTAFVNRGTAFVNKEIYSDILRRRLSDAGRRKRPKNIEPTVGSAITTVLQHTYRFCSRICYHRTM